MKWGRKILVCGSQTWTDADAIADRLGREPDEPLFMTGQCPRGADLLAEMYCDYSGLFCARMPAPWKRWGKEAGFARNSAMLRWKPDLVIAFWDGKSNGTHDTIRKAKQLGIPVDVIIAATHASKAA